MTPTMTLETEIPTAPDSGEISVLRGIARAGMGAKPYATECEAGRNVMASVLTDPEEQDGLNVVEDIALTYTAAVAWGRQLVQQIPDDLIDIDLGSDT
jgi:hypothetical protein